jgi:hypothetical protein
MNDDARKRKEKRDREAKRKASERKWTDIGRLALEGRTIESVRYMNEEEAKEMDWDYRPLVIFFTDGGCIYASKDDEGNDGGALFGMSSGGDDQVFPVMR